MVRTLTPRPKAGSRALILPGTSEAEPWESWTDDKCNGSGQTPSGIGETASATLALPVTQVISLSLWLSETDETKFDEIIELQLEVRGLQTRGIPGVFDWTIVAREPKRTLVLVGVLPVLLPPELEKSNCSAFDVSARCFQLPPHALVLWMEQGHLVAAVTREDSLCYFQALDDSTLSTRAIQELTCVLASLQLQEVVDHLRTVVFWTDELPAGTAELASALHLQVAHEERPAPRLPTSRGKLTPAQVQLAKRHRSARRLWMLALTTIVLLLSCVLLALGGRFFITAHEVGQLRQWQANHASTLVELHNTKSAWKALQPAIDATSYPLETLLQVSNSLPREQVHLTLFEAKGTSLLIKAEAKDLKSGMQFFDQVKSNPRLGQYTWEMSQPHSLPNDLTQLQIQGTKAP